MNITKRTRVSNWIIAKTCLLLMAAAALTISGCGKDESAKTAKSKARHTAKADDAAVTPEITASETPAAAPAETSEAPAASLWRPAKGAKAESVAAPEGAPEGVQNVDKITLQPDATILQNTAMDIQPGSTVKGEVWLWSAAPAKVIVQVARDADAASGDSDKYEGQAIVCDLTSTPRKFEVTHTFAQAHTMSRVLIMSKSEADIEFFACGVKLDLQAGGDSGGGR